MRYFSCLLIGPPGSGKTTAAATAPSPVLFLDIDNKLHKMENMESRIKSGQVVQWSIDDPLVKTKLKDLAIMDPKPGAKSISQMPTGYIHLADMIDKLIESQCVVDGKKIETIVLDSYTSTNEHLKRLLMSVNQTVTMTLPLYGTILTNFETLNNTLLRLPANVIFICHQKADKDELTGEISYAPLIDGQMSVKIGKDFEEVYYMEKKIQGEKAVYEMLTVGSTMKPCRTSRVLSARVVPDFGVIYAQKKV
jgi:hypothetical protein